MLVSSDGLARRLEASAPLGAHHSRLPARALLLQPPEQRDPLAAPLAYRQAWRSRARRRTLLLPRPNPHSPGPPAAAEPKPWPFRTPTVLASALALRLAHPGQGTPPGSPLAPGISRQPHRMARPTHAPPSRRNPRTAQLARTLTRHCPRLQASGRAPSAHGNPQVRIVVAKRSVCLLRAQASMREMPSISQPILFPSLRRLVCSPRRVPWCYSSKGTLRGERRMR